jgi:hypothetical protein
VQQDYWVSWGQKRAQVLDRGVLFGLLNDEQNLETQKYEV